ncbi:MAG: hypothetical protein AVDCRST_MAG64-4400, partial [uncultured Phycisphaerae bacterium]
GRALRPRARPVRARRRRPPDRPGLLHARPLQRHALPAALPRRPLGRRRRPPRRPLALPAHHHGGL